MDLPEEEEKRKSTIFGLVQIDETGLCPVLVELALTGSQSKFSTSEALLNEEPPSGVCGSASAWWKTPTPTHPGPVV